MKRNKCFLILILKNKVRKKCRQECQRKKGTVMLSVLHSGLMGIDGYPVVVETDISNGYLL